MGNLKNLAGAYLRGANLRGADLSNVNLRGVNLRGADLSEANLHGADLSGADLTGADIRDVNLRGADLSEANLVGAVLICADLYGAKLSGTNLRGADFHGAELTQTVLDPNVVLLDPTETLIALGLKVGEGRVYGWRTRRSVHVGNTDYTALGKYVAPYFSSCRRTGCHPGIYFATREWLVANYSSIQDPVYVRANIGEVVVAEGKVRAKCIERIVGP